MRVGLQLEGHAACNGQSFYVSTIPIMFSRHERSMYPPALLAKHLSRRSPGPIMFCLVTGSRVFCCLALHHGVVDSGPPRTT